MPTREPIGSDHSLIIAASPGRVLSAFFDPVSLASWWQVVRSIATPRPLGIYAVEWDPTEFRDEILGPLGGVFYGTVMEFKPGRECFIGGAYWLPPEGEPIGPMALEITCTFRPATVSPARPAGTLLRVCQRGIQDGERSKRYYDVTNLGWQRALESLRHYLER